MIKAYFTNTNGVTDKETFDRWDDTEMETFCAFEELESYIEENPHLKLKSWNEF